MKMSYKKQAVFENKRKFVNDYLSPLLQTADDNIVCVDYVATENLETVCVSTAEDEIVINVTGDSLKAVLTDVIQKLYGI